MDYTISKPKRNLIIFCTVLLILKSIILVVLFQSLERTKPDLVIVGIGRILHIMAFGYILIMLYDFFNHYKLEGLKILVLCILGFEIASTVFHLIPGIPEKNALNYFNLFLTTGWVLTMIIWTVFLFRNAAANFLGLISIRKFAIAQIAIIPVNGIVPLLMGDMDIIQQYMGIVSLALGIIPSLFIIEYAMKLKLKE
jgi:hypothetical protein